MDTLSALTSRLSCPKLTEPGPTDSQCQQLLEAAIRAPDHGVLRPWRFIVLCGEQRNRLADIMETELLQNQPDADARTRENARSKAFRAPMVIVAVAEVTENHKVPVWEQVVAVGAAVQNMMVAAHAMGLGAMWRTGAIANAAHANRALGFEDKDQIVAYLYLGTPCGSGKKRPLDTPQAYLREPPSCS